AALRRPGAVQDDRRGTEVAFLFPGQGSQRADMASGLLAGEPVFREAFDRCASILKPLLDLDLSDDAKLRHTALAQPALFAVEYATARLLTSWGVAPSAMAGHSIGEYVAACLAGVFSLEDALKLVAVR